MAITKTVAKALQKNRHKYSRVHLSVQQLKNLNFFETEEDEVMPCCARTAYDVQSGFIHCGKVSDYVAEVKRDGEIVGVIAFCKTHFRRFRTELSFHK